MISNSSIKIETNKFLTFDSESQKEKDVHVLEEAFCLRLQNELPNYGINVPFFCNEDWGWWLEIEYQGFKTAVCIYSSIDICTNNVCYGIVPAEKKATKWYWSELRRKDISQYILAIIDIIERLFQSDQEIVMITRHNDYPL